MADVTVNGVRLNYRTIGSGPDVALLHGLAGNQAFWNLEVLAALAAEFRVTTFDLRGHGYSSMPPAGYGPADLAGDLEGLLDHLGSVQAHLVGHSYGGVVAVQFALRCPQRVRSLVLADSRFRTLQPENALTGAPDWPQFRALLARGGIVLDETQPEIGISLLEALASPRWQAMRQRFAAAAKFVPFGGAGQRSAQRWLRLLGTTTARADFRTATSATAEQLRSLRLPVLALYGEYSPHRGTFDQLSRLLADCRAVTVPGAGHFHPASRPEFFLGEVQAFLRRCRSGFPA
jgi:pimeloyl-ACP methyl ester carboxylesterase